MIPKYNQTKDMIVTRAPPIIANASPASLSSESFELLGTDI